MLSFFSDYAFSITALTDISPISNISFEAEYKYGTAYASFTDVSIHHPHNTTILHHHWQAEYT